MKDSISRVDNLSIHRFGQKLARKDNRQLSSADNSAFLVYISILFLRENVNRTDDIPLPIVDIFISGDFDTACVLPYLTRHLTRAVIDGFHCVAVGVGHLLEFAVAVFVSISDQRLCFVMNADAFKIMERIVGKGILHAVAACDLGHVVKGIVRIGYGCHRIRFILNIFVFVFDEMAFFVSQCSNACYLSGSARSVILVCRLVTKSVDDFFIAGSILVHGVKRCVAACVRLTNEIIAILIKGKGAVQRTKLAVGVSGLVTASVGFLNGNKNGTSKRSAEKSVKSMGYQLLRFIFLRNTTPYQK